MFRLLFAAISGHANPAQSFSAVAEGDLNLGLLERLRLDELTRVSEKIPAVRHFSLLDRLQVDRDRSPCHCALGV
jgi:hypothetical protein